MFLKKKLYIDMSSTCGSLLSPNKKIIGHIYDISHNHEIKIHSLKLSHDIKCILYEYL